MSALLNAPQREAIRYLDGPCLVLAGAGSGKTRVITHKIAHLIDACGLNPANIAAITFTNKAAKEMQERVAHLMGGRAPGGLTVCTFHALGVRIVRQVRWGWSATSVRTSSLVARIPARCTVRVSRVTVSGSTASTTCWTAGSRAPASRSAPSSMSPATPPDASIQACSVLTSSTPPRYG